MKPCLAVRIGCLLLIVFALATTRGLVAQTEPFDFVQLSDPQLGMGGYEGDVSRLRRAVERINALEPDFVVICGDLVNEANASSFADFNEIKAGFAVPCYCAAGNHDVGDAPTVTSLESYRRVMGKDYYSFEHKGCTFVVANTQLWKAPVAGESAAHDRWFKETLWAAAAGDRPIFVITHHPLFVSAPDEADSYFNLPAAKRSELLALLVNSGVVAVLSGHTHRNVINEHGGVQFLCGESTSRNFDGRPYGFRLWRVAPGKRPTHEFVPLEGKNWRAEPTYARVNTSTSYEVDAGWPQRPEECVWGHVPGIAVDAQDRVWVFTRAKPPVQVYDTSGKFLFAWGEDLVGTAHHLKIDPQGNVWLSDIGRHVVRKCSPDGKVLMTLGTEDEPGNDERHFNKPTDMVLGPDGDIFVSDGYGNNRVVRFDADGKFTRQWGGLGTEPGRFSLPHAIAMDSNKRLYVADRNNARVQVFNREGKFLAEWRDLLVPWGFWVTSDDRIWICGSSPMVWRPENRVLGCPPKDQLFMQFDPQGKLLELWMIPKGTKGAEKPGELNWVHAMALDAAGNIYAGDIIGQRAQKFVRRPTAAP